MTLGGEDMSQAFDRSRFYSLLWKLMLPIVLQTC